MTPPHGGIANCELRISDLETNQSAKPLFIHRLFSEIAPRYDWFNRIASMGLDQRWRRQAVAASGASRGMDVLDVCAGTGDLALLCATHTQRDGMAPPPAAVPRCGTLGLKGREVAFGDAAGGGVVVGVDFNHAMLQAALRKQQAAGLAVHWLLADAQSLPFRSESFDRIFIGFSTRNLNDLAGGLREMCRLLKANGKLIVLETGRPSNRLVRIGHLLFLFTAARLIGWLLTGRLWPFTYLARSVKGFVTPTELVALLNACGTRACYLPLSGGLASLYIAEKFSTS
jgi:demethylmenaquinone methyltransferase/2-methoxy-6-polyprenyl-1,4-benzoquinol methylase